MEHSIENIERRLDKHGEELDELRQDRAELRETLRHLDRTVSSLEETVKKLEMKPANNWETISQKLLWLVVSGVVGYTLALIFCK